MLKQDLYEKTVSILVDAYFNDTLEHGNCYACAVGNIIAANCGYSYESDPLPSEMRINTGMGILYWDALIPITENLTRPITAKRVTEIIKKPQLSIRQEYQLLKTGYSFNELCSIEKAFEDVVDIGSTDEYMFNGLMAVIEALDIIHENTDETVTYTAKKRFVKQLA